MPKHLVAVPIIGSGVSRILRATLASKKRMIIFVDDDFMPDLGGKEGEVTSDTWRWSSASSALDEAGYWAVEVECDDATLDAIAAAVPDSKVLLRYDGKDDAAHEADIAAAKAALDLKAVQDLPAKTPKSELIARVAQKRVEIDKASAKDFVDEVAAELV